MIEKVNPPGVRAPNNDAYHHVAVIPPGARIAHLAGQVGMRPDGTTPESLEEQAEQAWANVMAGLAAVGMGAEHVAKVNAYLLDATDYGAFAAARSHHLGNARPASTVVLVRGLLRPEWRFEIEVVAAAVP